MSELERAFEFQLKVFKIPYKTEVRFHPTRKWRFDFTLSKKLAVEIEGGTWVQGRHNRASSFEKDCEKYAEAALLGWRVMRFTGKMVEDGRAIEYVRRALAGKT